MSTSTSYSQEQDQYDKIYQFMRLKNWEDDLANLCKGIVKMRLDLYEGARSHAHTIDRGSLFAHSMRQLIEILEDGSDYDIRTLLDLPPPVFKRLWESPHFTYDSFRRARGLLQASERIHSHSGLTMDIDEWILANERGLRAASVDAFDWEKGLVDWARHVRNLFPPPTSIAPEQLASSPIVITRDDADQFSGYMFLDNRRSSMIEVQPTFEGFQAAFAKVSAGVFDGMDWDHIFVAGGSVLSSLISVQEEDFENHVASDIDVYIYGLNPSEAAQKVRHVFDIWEKNLPEHARLTTLAVRNSRTITFLSEYPSKRVQIVLMSVKSPLDVLLNFDLDICSMGYDGKRLLMLPKAARALETGYNVFNMDWVDGHWLNRRQPSMPIRVFKYADKGYGVRITQRYLNASGLAVDVLQSIANRANEWTERTIDSCLLFSPPDERPNGSDDRTREAVNFFGWGILSEEPHTSEAKLLTRGLGVGFESLLRHVALWEASIDHSSRISQRSTVTQGQDSEELAYGEDKYKWDPSFNIGDLMIGLRVFNSDWEDNFFENIARVMSWRGQTASTREEYAKVKGDFIHRVSRPKRVTYSRGIEGVLGPEDNIKLMFFAPQGFGAFAKQIINQALAEVAPEIFPLPVEPLEILATVQIWSPEHRGERFAPNIAEAGELDILQWNINAVLTWQHLDARIDEVHSVLWALYRSHSSMESTKKDRTTRFLEEASKRSIRGSAKEDAAAFRRWIERPVDAPSGWEMEARGAIDG
ncbi:hypothetical protein DL93DRAFT_542341 [Clavulina sp. PMI_390]|nr:hypothetical protein DL93DRAFT_542341 [Clavulina sp. PMI_390]